MPHILPLFPLESQQKSQWCWAAVCAAIQNIFNRRPKTQNEIAALFSNGNNMPASLVDILSRLGYATNTITSSFDSYFDSTFIPHLNRNMPICAILDGIDTGYGHAEMIYGWDTNATGTLLWKVYDPLRIGPGGQADTTYATIADGYYLGNRRWVAAYLVAPLEKIIST